MPFVDWLWKFYMCSFLGWILETASFSIRERRWVNRGFLNGPFCPIYGFGAILILAVLEPLSGFWPVVLLTGIVLTTVLEYLTSWILEKLFNARWWDYSNKPLNFQGRITLFHTLFWGMLCMLLVYGLDPVLNGILSSTSVDLRLIAGAGLTMLIFADLSMTVFGLIDLDRHLANVQEKLKQIRIMNSDVRINVRNRLLIMANRFRELRIDALKISNVQIRLLKAFPNLSSLKYPEATRRLRRWIQKRKPKQKWPMAGIRILRNQLPTLNAYRKNQEKKKSD